MSDQSLYLLTDAAERTGLTVEAIRQRIKRGKLEAVKGNDGMLRVRLTTADLEALDRSSPGRAAPTAAGQPVNDDRLLKALQEAAEARGEAVALRERAEMAEARAERAEAETATERARAAQAEREREAARIAAAAAEGEAKGLREALAEARRPFWRRWLGLAALCAGSVLLPAVASAQVNPDSATWAMPGCRAAIYKADTRMMTVDESFLAGACHGMVRGLLSADPGICAPNGSTQGQAVRVVVQYIDARPARQHENFVDLATEALRSAWPCR